MGVKKLQLFVSDNNDAKTFKNFPLPGNKRATVLLDTFSIALATSGYATNLAREGYKHGYIHPDTDILGGEAPLLKEACRRILVNLRTHCRMNLVLLHDANRFADRSFSSLDEGENQQLLSSGSSLASPITSQAPQNGQDLTYATRNAVLDKRRTQREDEARQRYRYCCGEVLTKSASVGGAKRGASHAAGGSSVAAAATAAGVPPAFFGTIVKIVIDEVNSKALADGEDPATLIRDLQLVLEDGEVDEAIGTISKNLNPDLIVSSDTDLLVTNHGCPVAFTNTFPWEELVLEESALSPVIQFPTTSHDDLCRALVLNPSPSPVQLDSRAAEAYLTHTGNNITEAFLDSNAGDTLLLYVACGLCGNDVTSDLFFNALSKLPKPVLPMTIGKKEDNDADGGTSKKNKKKKVAKLTETESYFANFIELTNDVVTSNAGKIHKIVEYCSRLLVLRTAAAEENKRISSLASLSSNCPNLSCLKALLSIPELLASTQQYLVSSNPNRNIISLSVFSHAGSSRVPLPQNFAPHLTKNRDQLAIFFSRFIESKLRTGFVGLVDGVEPPALDVTFDVFTAVGNPLTAVHTKTFRRMHDLFAGLVLSQRRACGVDISENIRILDESLPKSKKLRNSKTAAAAAVDPFSGALTRASLDSLVLPSNMTWYDVANLPSESRAKILTALFNPSLANAAAAIESCHSSSVFTSSSHCLSLPEAVLWTSHPSLFEDELNMLAVYLAVAALPPNEQQYICEKMEAICNSNKPDGNNDEGDIKEEALASTAAATKQSKQKTQLSKKAAEYWKTRGVESATTHHHGDGGHVLPNPRAMMMSQLLAKVLSSLADVSAVLMFDSVDHLFSIVNQQQVQQDAKNKPTSSKKKSDNDKFNGPTVDAIVSSNSGSLLHYLYEKRASLSTIKCLNGVVGPALAMAEKVLSLGEVFKATETSTYGDSSKNGQTNEENQRDHDLDDEDEDEERINTVGYGCLGSSSVKDSVSGGAGDRAAATGWVGMLHRDELADLMDDGDTEVVSGGVVVGSNRLDTRRKNLANNVVASAAATLQAKGEPPLPILEHMPKILRTVKQNNVVCIQGETGCGKSSMIPLEIYRDAVSRGEHVNIIVTQPRRLAARSLADRVASLLGQKVGEVVGYRMGGGTEFHCDSKATRIRFVTTGYLLESLISNAGAWADVTHIILDEVHERSLDADMLSLVLKVMLGERMGMNLEELQALDAACHSWDEAKAVTEDDLAREAEEEHFKAHHRIVREGFSDTDNESAVSEEGPAWEDDTTVDKNGNVRHRGVLSKSSTAVGKALLSTSSATAPKKILSSKVVVMSATIQAKLFQSYFSALMQENLLAPNIFVGAKRFPVKELFLDEFLDAFPSLPDRVRSGLFAYNMKAVRDKPPSLRNEATTAIVDVALASVRPGTAILVFLPGLDEIEGVVEQLQSISDNTPSLVCKLRVFAVHSVVDINDQTNSIKTPEENECNIIVATNIAETSLTIPNLRIVVDAGMSKRMTHDAQRNIRMLVCGWCSKSAAKQRAGRTGRVGPGMVVRMYPRATYESHMPDFDPSEFYPLEYSVLQVRHHLSHFGTIQEVMSLLIEPPEADEIEVAIRELVKIGALDEEEHVTSFGRVALRMPVDLRMTKGLMAAAALGCAAEMVVIVAGLSMQKAMFARPIRPFFETETTFLSAILSVARTSGRFERIPHSDIHTFLSLFAFSQLPRHKQVQLINQVERSDVAFRSLGTFAKSCRNIANSLLGLGLKFHPDDEVYLSKITAFQGHKRGVVEEDDEDEDEEEIAEPASSPVGFKNAAAIAAKKAKDAKEKAKAAEDPNANPMFPWEFRAMTTPSHNALLQIALASASDCTFEITNAPKKSKPAAPKKTSKKKGGYTEGEEDGGGNELFPDHPTATDVYSQIPHHLAAKAPALAALPSATLNAINPNFLIALLKIEPVGFLSCTPAKLPYYFSRTITFKTPPRIVELIRDEFANKCTSLHQGDINLRPNMPMVYTSSNSNVVRDYEASFTKICSGFPATLTVSLPDNRAVLSYGLQELGLTGHAASIYKDTSAAAKIVILKRGKAVVPPIAPVGNAVTSPTSADAAEKVTEMMSKLEINALALNNATGEPLATTAASDINRDEAFLNQPHRLQLVPIHPAIRGLLMAGFIHRSRSIIVPISPPTLTSGEGEALDLKEVTTMCVHYKMTVKSDRVSGQCAPDRWSAFCTPETLPVVPLHVQEEITKASQRIRKARGGGGGDAGDQNNVVINTGAAFRDTLTGLCFGLMSLGERSLAVGSSVVVGGTPLQLLLTLASTSIVEERIANFRSVPVFLTYAPQTAIARIPTFVSSYAGINLQGVFNATDRSTMCSTFGAPLHGLVAVLAATILIHTAKSPSQFQRERVRLLQCLRKLESVSAYLPDNEEELEKEEAARKRKEYYESKRKQQQQQKQGKDSEPPAVAASPTPASPVPALLDPNDFHLMTYSERLDLTFDLYRFNDHSVCLLPNLERFFETDMFVGEDGYDQVLPRAAASALEEVYGIMERICRYESPDKKKVKGGDDDSDGGYAEDDEGEEDAAYESGKAFKPHLAEHKNPSKNMLVHIDDLLVDCRRLIPSYLKLDVAIREEDKEVRKDRRLLLDIPRLEVRVKKAAREVEAGRLEAESGKPLKKNREARFLKEFVHLHCLKQAYDEAVQKSGQNTSPAPTSSNKAGGGGGQPQQGGSSYTAGSLLSFAEDDRIANLIQRFESELVVDSAKRVRQLMIALANNAERAFNNDREKGNYLVKKLRECEKGMIKASEKLESMCVKHQAAPNTTKAKGQINDAENSFVTSIANAKHYLGKIREMARLAPSQTPTPTHANTNTNMNFNVHPSQQVRVGGGAQHVTTVTQQFTPYPQQQYTAYTAAGATQAVPTYYDASSVSVGVQGQSTTGYSINAAPFVPPSTTTAYSYNAFAAAPSYMNNNGNNIRYNEQQHFARGEPHEDFVYDEEGEEPYFEDDNDNADSRRQRRDEDGDNADSQHYKGPNLLNNPSAFASLPTIQQQQSTGPVTTGVWGAGSNAGAKKGASNSKVYTGAAEVVVVSVTNTVASPLTTASSSAQQQSKKAAATAAANNSASAAQQDAPFKLNNVHLTKSRAEAKRIRHEFVTKKRPTDTIEDYNKRLEKKRDQAQKRLERACLKHPSSGPAPSKKELDKMITFQAMAIHYQNIIDIVRDGGVEGAPQTAVQARLELIAEAEQKMRDSRKDGAADEDSD